MFKALMRTVAYVKGMRERYLGWKYLTGSYVKTTSECPLIGNVDYVTIIMRGTFIVQ